MLDYSELTVVKNSDGITTALGYPINSFMLQNNKPLFVGGGRKDNEHLAVPAGLVCMTQTICRPANEMGANEMGANEMGANEMANACEIDPYERDAYEIEDEREIVPEGLYERLMELAEVKERKKMSKRKYPVKKNKTHKQKL
jgi:hypothetical protein